MLYLETDASGIGLGTALLQVRQGMNFGHNEVPDNATPHLIVFTSKSLSSMKGWHSNTKWEALGILHGLEKSQHYCFANVITDHKPLVMMVNKDIAMLLMYFPLICVIKI